MEHTKKSWKKLFFNKTNLFYKFDLIYCHVALFQRKGPSKQLWFSVITKNLHYECQNTFINMLILHTVHIHFHHTKHTIRPHMEYNNNKYTEYLNGSLTLNWTQDDLLTTSVVMFHFATFITCPKCYVMS